jgi:hypothetical protein
MDCPQLAVGLFGLTALGGATLATFHFRRGAAPAAIAGLHGLAALTSLGTLTAAVVEGSATGLARAALGVFSLAALGGAYFLIGFRLLGRPIPRPFIVGHGLLAVTGFALLCAGVLGRARDERMLGARELDRTRVGAVAVEEPVASGAHEAAFVGSR